MGELFGVNVTTANAHEKYTDTEKWCGYCERGLPHADFAMNRTASHGLVAWCRECNAVWRQVRSTYGTKEAATDPNNPNAVVADAAAREAYRVRLAARKGATLASDQRPCWFVGASLGESEDQTERFIQEGIWEHDFEDNAVVEAQVNAMRPGDRIAIKASTRQKNNLPFDYHGEFAPFMYIKAIGTVTQNLENGRRIQVDWTPMKPWRQWYFRPMYFTTVSEVWPGSGEHPWTVDALIRFTFENEDQDYDRFLRAWGVEPTGETEPSEDDEGDTDDPQASLQQLAVEELYFKDASFLEEIVTLLGEKKQVIFQGPPGTGKTYVARKLAKHLAGAAGSVELVQFHPSYAYEDFVQGYRPALSESGQATFKIVDGPLVRAADRARKEADARHFLVIDEINRGNLGKVFGELYFLLEYRDEAIRLQYSDKEFSLPKNLYIIGTMNTADRSIALMDLALRRRFYFKGFHPSKWPIDNLLRDWLAPDMRWVADVVDAANKKLAGGRPEDWHAAIGPSYFMRKDEQGKPSLGTADVERIWEHSVLPYIEEHLYGQHERLGEFTLSRLRKELDGAGEQEPGDEDTDDDSGAGDASG